MCTNLQRLSALECFCYWLCCHGLLRCHQSEAQQMILAAAFLVQLGLHGSVPRRVMMIREEKDTGRKAKETSQSFQIRNQLKIVH